MSSGAPNPDRWADLRAAIERLPVEGEAWRTWEVEDDDPDWNVRTSDGFVVCDDCADDDYPRIATYIATADPTTIAALLAERDAAVSRAERAEALIEPMRQRGWSSGAIYGQGLEEAADALDVALNGAEVELPEWAAAALAETPGEAT